MPDLPIGTRVQINGTLTGTVIDPDSPTMGAPEGTTPPYPAAWVYLDREHHTSAEVILPPGQKPGPRHGGWWAIDSPSIVVLAQAEAATTEDAGR